MQIEQVIQKLHSTFSALHTTFGWSNPMQAVKVSKVVLSTGTGKIDDKRKIALIQDRLYRITGQKPARRPARKSIASFKLREGDIIGYQVTLHGKSMTSFLDRLIHIALPRMRDFRGIDPRSVDEMGNMTIGVKEHTIFPEVSDEDLADIFGLSVTIVTSSKDQKEARTFFEHLGFRFKK